MKSQQQQQVIKDSKLGTKSMNQSWGYNFVALRRAGYERPNTKMLSSKYPKFLKAESYKAEWLICRILKKSNLSHFFFFFLQLTADSDDDR